jgi:hypothetical protein
MIDFGRHRIFAGHLMRIAVILVTLIMTNGASAAVSEGPNYTNAVVAEQRRIAQFHQAEDSFQEQLRAGRQRYHQKQITRAKIIAAMAEELQARQQAVGVQPSAASHRSTDEPVLGSGFWLALASLVLGGGGLRWSFNRQRAGMGLGPTWQG